jgi:hypothetical protein
LKGVIIMLSLLFGVGFGEIIWASVLKKSFTIQYAKGYTWFLTGLNFVISIISGSIASLEIAIVLSLYVLVIFNLRESKNARKT